MEQQYQDVIWPDWNVVRKIGEGSYGGVYEIQRTLPDGYVEKAALKKLVVPRDPGEIEELKYQSYSDESITAHYKSRLEDLVKEYRMMQSLNSCPNIVNCYDLKYIQHQDGIGWDIYIRMELLQPLKKVLDKSYQEKKVVDMGIGLCTALMACHEKKVIHRDIKPENILVSSEGIYKLGDFGVAKVSEKTGTGTMIGTTGYMAPEVAKHSHYGFAADIYSLGLVMYWMMNDRTLPFLPRDGKIPSPAERQNAVNRRCGGETLPEPANGSSALKKIVLKACEFDPEKRYHSAAEFREDLQRLAGGKPVPTPVQPPDPEPVPAPDPSPVPGPDPEPDKKPLWKKWIPIALLAVAVVAGLVFAIASCSGTKDSGVVCESLKTNLTEITLNGIGTQLQLEVSTEPDNVASAVSFSSQDSAVASVDNNGLVTAVSAGDTVISVRCGGISQSVPVTVTDRQEPVLKLTLTPQDIASFTDVKHDVPILIGRIQALSDKAQVEVDEENGVIYASIPLEAVGYSNDLETVIRAVVNRPLELCFVKVNGWEYSCDDDAVVPRSEIVSVEAASASRLHAECGLPMEYTDRSGDAQSLSEDQPCILFRLTEKGAKKASLVNEGDGLLTLGTDIDMSLTYYPYFYALPDGVSFIAVPTSWQEPNIAEALVYGYTHDTLNNGFYYDFTIEPVANWETRESADYFGARQCNYTELPDPENAVTIRLKVSDISKHSDELLSSAFRQIKDKMDIVGNPYAFGPDIRENGDILIITSPEKLNYNLLRMLSETPSIRLADDDINVWNLTVKDTNVVPIPESGGYGLQIRYTNADAVKELTSKLRWRDNKSFGYGFWGENHIVSTTIKTTINEDTITLERMPLFGKSKVDEDSKYILELLAYTLTQERTGVYCYLDEYTFTNDDAHFGLSNLTEDDAAVLDYISENYPEATAYFEDNNYKKLVVILNTEIKKGFIDDGFDAVEDIFKNCKIDSMDIDTVVITLIEEIGDQRCRLVFSDASSYSNSPYMECIGNCRGGLLDSYKEEFENHARWRLFFQKRNFEMYTG